MSPGPGELTPLSLLEGLRRAPQCPALWHRFVGRYGRQVRAWCRAWGLQEADADDVTQNVLMRLCRLMPAFEYDPARRFRSWLRAVARGAWTDWYRRQSEEAARGGSSVLRRMGDLPAPEDLARRLESAYDLEKFDAALSQVKRRVAPQTWRAFELTALKGMSGAEAAAAIPMEVGQVYVARTRVQNLLKAALEQLTQE